MATTPDPTELHHETVAASASEEVTPIHLLVTFSVSDGVNQGRRPQFRSGVTLAAERLAHMLTEAGFFEGAAFSWITGIVRLVQDPGQPAIGRVSSRYRDLPITVEISGHELRHSSRDAVSDAVVRESLSALIAAGRRHDRPVEPLIAALAGFGAGRVGSDRRTH